MNARMLCYDMLKKIHLICSVHHFSQKNGGVEYSLCIADANLLIKYALT